jgi:hypothetical protein
MKIDVGVIDRDLGMAGRSVPWEPESRLQLLSLTIKN